MLVQGCQSRGLKRRPLLRTSSPLKSRINRELTLALVQQTGARQLLGVGPCLWLYVRLLAFLKERRIRLGRFDASREPAKVEIQSNCGQFRICK
jgi:hypothetical protein